MASISILVKALNEERRIEACLRAAVAEAQALDAEVIMVDSLSTDRTVELAQRFPVRIVQFESIGDRSCAAAVQLGYQFARSEFVYVLDADMVLQPGFLARALEHMRADPGLAGVGGKLIDERVSTASDLRRRVAAARLTVDTEVSELGGGGLYRAAAVAQTGYLAHRGLAAFEEAELGARLRSAGWRLLKLAEPAVVHEGHAESNWQMLRRLWRNQRAQASGAVLRAALGQPWFWRLARKQAFLVGPPLVWTGAAALALAAGGGAVAWGVAFAVAYLIMGVGLAVHRQGVSQALWALVFYHFFLLAALVGAGRSVLDPHQPVAGREITVPPTRSGSFAC